MWILFVAPYEFNPPERYGRTTISYRAGELRLVRRICAEWAIARGVAIRAERPAREAR
jgi:hypothetical protein